LQPWVSDGTSAGTYPLTGGGVRVPDAGFSSSPSFVEAGGHVYFLFGKTLGSLAIWRTDGTPAGTDPAVTAASGAVKPVSLSEAGGRLFFAAREAKGSTAVLPWASDGSDEGTVLLTRAELDLGPSFFEFFEPPKFVELYGRVFFAASDPQHDEELWSTDGTPEGTEQLTEIAPGLLDANPRELKVWNGRLYFRARDAMHGMELWTSDGTAEGTRLVQDIFPGPSWSKPADLTATEQGLYFSAHNSAHGRELWVLPPDELEP